MTKNSLPASFFLLLTFFYFSLLNGNFYIVEVLPQSQIMNMEATFTYKEGGFRLVAAGLEKTQSK